MPPNPSVNADAPVRGGNLASCCGGAPVTLIRQGSGCATGASLGCGQLQRHVMRPRSLPRAKCPFVENRLPLHGSALRSGLAFCTRRDSRVPVLPQSLAKAVVAQRSASVMGGIADASVFAQSHATRVVRTEPPLSNTVFRSFCRSLCPSHTSLAPNPSVNPDAPVRVFNLANRGGGAPVTLIRCASWARHRHSQ